MAKVDGPLHSSEARGRMGSLVYNTWRGICYVKSHRDPDTQFTNPQIYIRGLTALCTARWQTLSALQHAAWQQYANDHLETSCTGQLTRLTGYNWFVRANVRRLLLGLAIQDTPPTHQVAHVVVPIVATPAGNVIELSWDATAPYTPADLWYEFWLTGPHSPGAYPTIRNAYRYGACLYDDAFYELFNLPSGWFSLWVKPIHSQGTSGITAKLQFTVP